MQLGEQPLEQGVGNRNDSLLNTSKRKGLAKASPMWANKKVGP
jgi:hypothetical protein